MCDAIRIAHPQSASDAETFFHQRCENTFVWSEITRKCQKKDLRCWPARRKIGVFKIERCCDSDSRCGLACDASTCDAKSLATCVERCEPLSSLLAGVLRGNTIRGNTTRNSERENGTLRGSLRGSLKNLWKPLKTSQKTSENLSKPLWKPSLSETLSEADFPLRTSQSCCP